MKNRFSIIIISALITVSTLSSCMLAPESLSVPDSRAATDGSVRDSISEKVPSTTSISGETSDEPIALSDATDEITSFPVSETEGAAGTTGSSAHAHSFGQWSKTPESHSRICQECGEEAVGSAALRMLVDGIVIDEKDGRLSVTINLKGDFRHHLDVYENGEITERFFDLAAESIEEN